MWPTKVRVVLPVASSQRRRVLSHDEERAYAPSDEITYDQLVKATSSSTKCPYAVGNDMGVTVKTSLWVAIGLVVTSEVPDDQRLISRSRKEHIWAVITLALAAHGVAGVALFERGSQAGDPAAVALKGTTVDELLSHDGQMEQSGERGAIARV